SDHTPLGNERHGILVGWQSIGTVIGLPSPNYYAPRPGPAGQPGTPYAANFIAYNGGNGVLVEHAVGTTIRGNSIYFNSLMGIDLASSCTTIGVTPNDVGDGDDGANHLQNYPVLTLATASNIGTTIVGTLNSNPGKLFTIDF